jgi:hypothetical protein
MSAFLGIGRGRTAAAWVALRASQFAFEGADLIGAFTEGGPLEGGGSFPEVVGEVEVGSAQLS